jgi:16S rRNA (cytidine1402-2'-O)-methyltransferase
MEDQKKNPVLYLIPSLLGENSPVGTLPPVIGDTIRKLRYFIVEDIRTARRFFKAVDKSIDIDSLQFSTLNEHTTPQEITLLLKPLEEGHDAGLVSEAGLPCVADPGSQLVRLAHESGYTVRPLPGPSSIFLALMASGFNGQNFIFNGYLPVDRALRSHKIREMEADTLKNDRTQVFIETPYRNRQLLESLLQTCRESTLLCIAINLACEDEKIMVNTIGGWKSRIPEINKVPAVFMLYH